MSHEGLANSLLEIMSEESRNALEALGYMIEYTVSPWGHPLSPERRAAVWGYRRYSPLFEGPYCVRHWRSLVFRRPVSELVRAPYNQTHATLR